MKTVIVHTTKGAHDYGDAKVALMPGGELRVEVEDEHVVWANGAWIRVHVPKEEESQIAVVEKKLFTP